MALHPSDEQRQGGALEGGTDVTSEALARTLHVRVEDRAGDARGATGHCAVKVKGQPRIGVITDTHGLFDPALIEHFAGVLTIRHAGDIGDLQVICELERIAPLAAVSGHVDKYEQSGFPRERLIRCAGVTIAMRHILFEWGRITPEARKWLDREQPDVCIFGHSHRPTVE